MQQIAGASADPDDDTEIDMQVAEAQYSEVQTLVHAMQTADNKVQLKAASWLIEITTGWIITWWSDSNVLNGNLLVMLLLETIQVVDLECTV